MGPPLVTYSWIGLTALTPLVAMLITWTLISVHKKRLKSILLLAILYAQLFFQLINFGHSTLSLLKMDSSYLYYLNFSFHLLVLFKSLSVVSLHLEEFYKLKSPSNYILNVNSSLLKYHLLVLFILSLMGAYFLQRLEFIPPTDGDLLMVGVFVTFHAFIVLMSLALLVSKILVRRTNLDGSTGVIVGTNSTSSSANLFGVVDGGRAQSMAASAVATVNLTINVSLVVCTFSTYWLPYNSWPLSNILTWSQLCESLVTPCIYWLAYAKNRRSGKHGSSGSHHLHGGSGGLTAYGHSGYDYDHHPRFPITNGSLCFNNGEFKYFAGGKNGSAMVLNNAVSSEYNTFDSFHQTRSYSKDSLRCASVTTIANDDFEFLSRAPPLPPIPHHFAHPTAQAIHPMQMQMQLQVPYDFDEELDEELDVRMMGRGGFSLNRAMAETTAASLSMNDLDLIECNETESGGNKCNKYKKNSHRIKRRFMGNNASNSSNNNNGRMNRRVLSLESLHNHVNESHLAYLDTGERVIVFTTDFL